MHAGSVTVGGSFPLAIYDCDGVFIGERDLTRLVMGRAPPFFKELSSVAVRRWLDGTQRLDPS